MSQKEVNEKMQRLEKARKVMDELTQKKSRLVAELDMHKKMLADIESKVKAEFGCSVAELDELAQKLEKEAETKLSEVECVLGLREAP